MIVPPQGESCRGGGTVVIRPFPYWEQPGISSAIFRFGMESPKSERHAVPAAEKCGQHHSKTQIVVPVVWIVPVTVGAAYVPLIIVERPATNNTGVDEPIPLTVT